MKTTMKLPVVLAALILLSALPMRADTDPKPVFGGVIVTRSQTMFNLASPGVAKSQWLGIGDSFGEWKLSTYDEKSGELLLKKDDGGELRLALAESKVDAAPIKATLADAQRVLEKIHFAEMLANVLAGQRAAQLKAMRQMLLKRGMEPSKADAIVAKQAKLFDRLWANIDTKDLQQTMAQIYSEEFTADQLSGISAFYDSDAGQAALAKQPEIQQKLMAVIMPKILAAQQQLLAEQQAAAKAAPAAAPAATGTKH